MKRITIGWRFGILACFLLACILLALAGVGCRTVETGREARPYDKLLDPVTEDVPNVIVVQ